MYHMVGRCWRRNANANANSAVAAHGSGSRKVVRCGRGHLTAVPAWTPKSISRLISPHLISKALSSCCFVARFFFFAFAPSLPLSLLPLDLRAKVACLNVSQSLADTAFALFFSCLTSALFLTHTTLLGFASSPSPPPFPYGA